jgi:hypothetical protein
MMFAEAFVQRNKSGFGSESSRKFWRKKVKDLLTTYVLGQNSPSREESIGLRRLCSSALLRSVGVHNLVEACAAGQNPGVSSHPLLQIPQNHPNAIAGSSDANNMQSGSNNMPLSAGLPGQAILPADVGVSIPNAVPRAYSNVERAEYTDCQVFADWVCQHRITQSAVNDLLSRLDTFLPNAQLDLPKRYATLLKVQNFYFSNFHYHLFIHFLFVMDKVHPSFKMECICGYPLDTVCLLLMDINY